MSVEERTHKQALAVGTRLQNYRVVRVLGVGGFGITYLAEHVTLGHQVAIKEYLPNDVAVREGATVHPKSEAERENFEWGLQRFLDEARTLSRFAHRNVVRVRDYFEANRTACLVMDYEDGEPLDALLERHGTLTEVQLRRVLLPIVAGLKEVHAAGFLHRDIKPSNVYVRRLDESPVLLDFGAARQALGRKSKSLTAVVSAGYSPPEQYESEGEQGPWTDIYTLSALCYRAITGDVPIEAPRRQSSLLRTGSDPLPRLSQGAFGGYSAALLEAVDWGLRVIEGERPQSLEEWGAALSGESAPEPGFGRSGTGQSIRGASKAESKAPRKRTRVVVLAGGIGAVVVVAVAALWWWSSTGEMRPAGETSIVPAPEGDVAPRSTPRQTGTLIDVLRAGGFGPEMVVIPAGTFRMGCLSQDGSCYGDENPVREVRIGAFALSKYEVTRGEFSRFVEGTGHSTGNSCMTLGSDQRDARSWRSPGFEQSDDHPVVCVNWQDAEAYVAWLSRETGEAYRLPSESEWEYATRAGSRSKYSFGSDASRLCGWGNGADLDFTEGVSVAGVAGCYDGFVHTAPVGTFRPNPFGLYDMHGNVWEWVQDCWNWSYLRAPLDGGAWLSLSGDCNRRVMRGGSWNNHLRSLRSANRSWNTTSDRYNSHGFRVARTLTP